MRTLSSLSRALSAGAVVAAALLVLGGAYVVGYVGELQRTLANPTAHAQASQYMAQIEQALGHAGFLKTYRNYRLTGDAGAPQQLTEFAIDAERALARLKSLYAGDAVAENALKEAASVGETFARVAQMAPETGSTALRGTAAMNELSSLPQHPQLEASYLALRTALDRLKSADLNAQVGGIADTLNWSQWILLAAIGALAAALLIAAVLLQLGIIQPLRTLERSLTAVGEGAVNQPVWGTARTDEFGAVARAGERLRRGLTESSALQAIAAKGEIHLTLDGQSSLLLQRLADEVTQTTGALKAAAADFAKLQDGSRRQLEAALANLQTSSAGANQAAEILRDGATAATAASTELNTAMAGRAERLDRLTEKFAQSRRQLAQLTAEIGEQAKAATGDLATSAATLKDAAESVGQIRTVLSQSFEDISAGAVKTTEKVRTLAARLSDTIGLVDERLSRKLAALDTLERTVTTNLASLRAKTEEASQAISAKAEELGRQAQRSAATESDDLKAAIARLDEIAERFAKPAPATSTAPNLDALAGALQTQLETVRGEIRDLAIRMTEERLLATGPGASLMTFGDDAFPQTRAPQRTLADVPGEEIMARLKDLAAEMNAAHNEPDHIASLKSALGKFAAEVKDLAASADRAPRLKAMGRALDEHAEEIEAHLPTVDPSSALRTELGSITAELRAIAARAQTSGAKDGTQLRDAAIEVGARAESLFTYLNETQPSDETDDDLEPAPTAAGDIAALTHLIDRIEARATTLATPGTNTAIHTVFESIGRLNNIATALARAGQRHATH